jgi:hypothetical protein
MYAGSAVFAQSRKPDTIRDRLGTAALRRADHSSLLRIASLTRICTVT